MARTMTGRSLRKAALLGVTGIFGLFALVLTLGAQEPGKQKGAEAKAADKGAEPFRTLVRSGYTRPGNPSDRVADDGTVMPLAFGEIKGRIIGATVYFAVYDRLGGRDDGPDLAGVAAGDTWG